MKYLKKRTSRRDFLKKSALASLGFATPFSSMNRMKSINDVLPTNVFPDYKAIVCLFLHGGNDSYNMLMPKSGQAYTDYATTRSNLALDPVDMLGIENDTYGLHPSLPNVHQMYQNDELAFLTNIGALVDVTTQADYLNNTVPLPLGLFSHLDQFNHWQTAQPDQRVNFGWGGKIADLIGNQNPNQNIPMNISLSGSNLFQYGTMGSEFSMNSAGPILPTNWDATWGHHPERRAATDSMLNASYSDIFMSTYTDIFKHSIEAGQEFQTALLGAHNFTTQFSPHYVSQNFHMVAKSLSIKDTLNFQRQIFWVRYGGWDHHDELLNNHTNYLSVVDNALGEFNSALKEINLFDDVIVFVISEFSRKLTSNGNGTDHAWGGNMTVMGGKVNGGTMYGNYPSLSLNNNPLLIHNGTLIPDTASDSMFAEIAMWYGISVGELISLFPNLGNFHDVPMLSSINPPIGFLDLS